MPLSEGFDISDILDLWLVRTLEIETTWTY